MLMTHDARAPAGSARAPPAARRPASNNNYVSTLICGVVPEEVIIGIFGYLFCGAQFDLV